MLLCGLTGWQAACDGALLRRPPPLRGLQAPRIHQLPPQCLLHWGREFCSTWSWSSGFWTCYPAEDPRRFCVVSCDQESKS